MNLEEFYSFLKENTRLDFVICETNYYSKKINSANAYDFYIYNNSGSFITYDLIKKGKGVNFLYDESSFSLEFLKQNEEEVLEKSKKISSNSTSYFNSELKHVYLAKKEEEYQLRNLDENYLYFNKINDLVNSLNTSIRNYSDIVSSNIYYSFEKRYFTFLNSNNVKFNTIDLASNFEITIVVSREDTLLTSYRKLSLTADFNLIPSDIIDSMYREALLSFNRFDFIESKYSLLLPNYLVSSLFNHLEKPLLEFKTSTINAIGDLNIVANNVFDTSYYRPCFNEYYYPYSTVDIVKNGKYVFSKRKNLKKIFNKKYESIYTFDKHFSYYFSILPTSLDTKDLIADFKDGIIITRVFGLGFSTFYISKDKLVISAHGLFIKDGNVLGFNYFKLIINVKKIYNNISRIGSDNFLEHPYSFDLGYYLFSSPTLVIDNIEVYKYDTFEMINENFSCSF